MISGKPALLAGGTTRRISTFHIRVTDAGGLIFDSGPLSITTNQEQIVFPLPGNLPDATRGVPYTFALPRATGGVPPYHYQLDRLGGFAPFGITIDPTGNVSGIPTQVQTRTFAICAVDTVGQNACPPTTLRVIEHNFELTVANAGHAVTSSEENSPKNVAAAGSGTVTSSPAGISCGAACTASFSSGTLVTLTAVAASGSTFTGWGGVCSGTGTCLVKMDADKAVTANFTSAGATVIVEDVFLGDGNNQPIASFKTGTTITLNVLINNTTGQTVNCTRRYRAIGPNGFTLDDAAVTGDQLAGKRIYFRNVAVPAGAPDGTYTLTGSAECNGVVSSKSVSFVNTGTPPTPTPPPPSSGSLTGTWTGTWTRQFSGLCAAETNNITWTLTHTGASITGTLSRVVTATDADSLCPHPVGARLTDTFVAAAWNVTASLNGSNLTLITSGGLKFIGTVSGATITGTGGNTAQSGGFWPLRPGPLP